jgi:hypothetical protein
MYEIRQRPVRLHVGHAHDRLPLRSASEVREARRAGNRARSGFVDELRCECARPGCRATFPAVAEGYRGVRERFIVVPEHGGGDDTVVAAADRFFVVELLDEQPRQLVRRRAVHSPGSEAA